MGSLERGGRRLLSLGGALFAVVSVFWLLSAARAVESAPNLSPAAQGCAPNVSVTLATTGQGSPTGQAVIVANTPLGAPTNFLQSISFLPAPQSSNVAASINLNGQWQVVAIPSTINFPSASTIVATLNVSAVAAGQPSTLQMYVVDNCGVWPTLIGAGTGQPFAVATATPSPTPTATLPPTATSTPSPTSTPTTPPSSTPVSASTATPTATTTATPTATMTVNLTSVARGGTIQVAWSNVPNPNTFDFIQLSQPNAPDNSPVPFIWVFVSCSQTPSTSSPTPTGATSGTCSFFIPYELPPGYGPGNYVIKYYAYSPTSQFVRVATSPQFTIT